VSSPFTAFSVADVVVVGAGPAGLTAAIAAADHGAQVYVFEQMDRPAAKLAAAGTAPRCLTLMADREAIAARFGADAPFVRPALEAMDPAALRRFLEGLGAPLHSPDGVHVVPIGDSGAPVQAAIWRRATELLGVSLRLGARVTGLCLEGGRVAGLVTDAGRQTVSRVILATGGRSYPTLGSTGSGYALAAQAGHAIIDPRPALVPLVIEEAWVRACAGTRLPSARIWIAPPAGSPKGSNGTGTGRAPPGRTPSAAEGEVAFTHTGLAGSAALDVSGDVAQLLAAEPAVPLRLNVDAAMSADAWLGRFAEWLEQRGGGPMEDLLAEHVPQPFARAMAAACGIPAGAAIAEVPEDTRRALAALLVAAPLTAIATEGFAAAMVTRGGIRLDDVDPQTLQSRIVHGLYFAGEMLDVDGPSGGYNLQWAFSSGCLAGCSAGSAD